MKILRYCRSQPFSKCTSQMSDSIKDLTLLSSILGWGLRGCIWALITIFTHLYNLLRSRFTSGQQEPPRGSNIRTSAQRDRQPKDANSALSWTWAPQVLKTHSGTEMLHSDAASRHEVRLHWYGFTPVQAITWRT